MNAGIVLTFATVLFGYVCWRRDVLRTVDMQLMIWFGSVTVWPIAVIYGLAPALWSEAEAAGPVFVLLMWLPGIGMSMLALLGALASGRVRVDLAAVIIGVLLVFVIVSMLLARSDRMINLIIAVALFAGFLLRDRSVELGQIAIAARWALAATAIVLLAFVLFNADRVVGACRVDKCTELDAALTSPFAGNGNLAGILVTLLLPFACYGLSPIKVVAATAGVAGVGLLAGSRTALVAVVVAGGLGLLLAVGAPAELRRLVLGLALVSSFVYSLLPFFFGYSVSDFSLRGYLWNHAFRVIPDQLLFGHNPSFWVDSGQSSVFTANYSPHNGWLEMLVSVGVWGVALVVVSAVVKLLSLRGAARDFALAYYAVVLCISSLEAVYLPYYLGIAPFAAFIPYFLYRYPVSTTTAATRSVAEQKEHR
ncbi:O-antigen ligase family protein [Gordonia iterans]